MEEIFLALFAGIAEFLCEFLAELFVEILSQLLAQFLFSSIWHFVRKLGTGAREMRFGSLIVLSSIFGLLSGWISIHLLPVPLFAPGKLHGISLILSPLATGTILASISYRMKRRDQNPVPSLSFWSGACFAFSMTLVRFLHL